MPPTILALDIGGANLKAAHSGGGAWLQPFALWENPRGLAGALRELLQRVPSFDRLAVTMTGELCDCFATKRDGVHAILDAVEAVAGSVPVQVWQTDGRLVEVAAARRTPLQTAAANWLALATYAARLAPAACGILVDVGSTTTDVVPFAGGGPIPAGRTDFDRLRCHELIYTGVRRTPLCALLGAEGAAEFFATTLDVYLLLGNVPEDEADRDTADGRPATRPAAYARLARMLCADMESCTEADMQTLARQVRDRQLALLRTALGEVTVRLPAPPQCVVTAGSGEFLARSALRGISWLAELPVLSLADKEGPAVSQAACAYALIVLALDQIRGSN
jgi:probable H4MPT-linked C1 transfer pathway protein